ncbi:MAG: hypothetical protein IS632_02530 [Thaumarchaeota archaeon]|nr:hypothetical protein [Nitrososphaerota archaeon]
MVFVFLPPIALAIIWSDKKFLKQMALAIFYMSTLFLLVYLFVFAGIIGYAQGMAGLVVLLTPAMLGMLFGILIAVYAQRTIIKAEERVRDGADP